MGRRKKSETITPPQNINNKYQTGYFYEKEQQAVIDYIEAETSEEKNKIFEESLKAALTPMIESIINKYKLKRDDIEFKETFDDTLAYLIGKMDKFTADKGRAYSYLQTIVKNYLICEKMKLEKTKKEKVSYDDHSKEINENEDYSHKIKENIEMNDDIISMMVSEIEGVLTNNTIKLTKNDRLVGKSLCEILLYWDDMFSDFGSNKFNKSTINYYIKETTNLSAKDIRNSMRKYKIIYKKTKESLL